MKEATGELNMSVVVISSIAILSAFFYTVLWPMMKTNQEQQSNCSKAICTTEKVAGKKGYVRCTYKDKENNQKNIDCKYKG